MRKVGFIASGVIVGSSLMIASSAIAGGFSIREQSTTGLGLAFADSAAGSDLSSMYWNPAAVTTQDGMNSLSSFSMIVPDTDIKMDAVGEIGVNKDDIALLGASYVNYQINRQLYVGLSINSPAGVATTTNPKAWQGDEYLQESELLTLNAAPTIGYKVTPEFSVAVGLQVEFMKVRTIQQKFIGVAPFYAEQKIIGDDIAAGFTLGALYKSGTTGTSIGIGYRSAIQHKIEGKLSIPLIGKRVDITADYEAPQMVTASIRQDLTPNFAVMANLEWTNWSVFKNYTFKDAATGTPLGTVLYDWNDGWYASIGAEMKMNEEFIGRVGVGFERSPVTDAERGPSTPDSDRLWLSFGGSYKWSESTTLDFGYSHIFFKDADIGLTADGGVTKRKNLNANVDNRADIVSVGMRMKW